MPRALAVETSGRIGSIALIDGDSILAEEQFAHGLANAAQILPIIDRLCRSRDWKPFDLRELYVSVGPGSFTGLRIGVTLCKTIAFATGAKIVAVPTARVLAENAPPEAQNLIIVLDAKREQIFTARFRRATPSPSISQYPASVAATPASPAPLPIEQSATRASQLPDSAPGDAKGRGTPGLDRGE